MRAHPVIMSLRLQKYFTRECCSCLGYLTLDRFVIERHHDIVNVRSARAECYVEPRSSEGLHPGGDVNAGPGGHQDLQVTFPSLGCVNYIERISH